MTPGAAPTLLTDLYQLTMLQAYHASGMNDTAVFEFFVRRLPERRNFLLAAGLEQVLDMLETLRFEGAELDWLRRQSRFNAAFVDSLADLRFSGDVDAVPEGTPCFADEPLLRVIAPLREAQLIESRVINLLQFQTLVASKAARVRLAAGDALLVDFGMRRAHGAEAALLSARASYLAGFDGSATVLAGMRWDIPLYGTMAHSYVQAHDDEEQAFARFVHAHPEPATLLIDTYDTEAAARKVVALAARLARDGLSIGGVRIDSGDLAEHARRVRAVLDAGGCGSLRIFASSNLDEDAVHALRAQRAPIDGFGVGTRMNTSADQPYLDCAYKLQEYAGVARRKRAEGKTTWPGRKQVWRRLDADGRACGDTLGLLDEHGDGDALLRPVMRGGARLAPPEPLAQIRARAATAVARLPAALLALDPATPYPVRPSAGLRALGAEVARRECAAGAPPAAG
jgi:nicotinate phosphoribosyltransferase